MWHSGVLFVLFYLINNFSFKYLKEGSVNWNIWGLHKILSTNSFLQKIKLKDTNTCTICRSETETIEHILWDCEIVQALQDDFVTFCSNKIHGHISLAKKNIYTWIHRCLRTGPPPPDIHPGPIPIIFINYLFITFL